MRKKQLIERLGKMRERYEGELRLRHSYADLYRDGRDQATRLLKTIDDMKRERTTVEKKTNVRYFVQAIEDGTVVVDDFDAKGMDIINHWIKDQKILNEDLTFKVTRSSTVEVNTAGKTQAEIEYRNRPYYGYSGLAIPNMLGY